MAEVNSDQAMQNTDSTPAVRRKLSLTPAEAMAEMDKLKDRVRSLSISSSVSAESTDSGSTGTGTRALVNVRKQDDLVSCLGVMRRLMEQAESESKRMREEKIVIAAKINTSLSAVNREVEYLKAELREQDKRLSELASTKLEQPAKAPEVNASGRRVSRSKLEIYKEDNDRLRCENEFLTKELNEWRQGNMDLDQLRQRLHSCEHEITRAKETISCMKVERKRLKTEKMTLLNQMKQVYGILEVKEAELREFIQNYEQRMREGEETIQRLEGEKQSWELERIDVLRESDSLRTQLALKEVELKDLEAELVEVKQHLAVLQSTLRENSSQLIFKTNNLNLDSTGGSVDSTSNSRNNQRSNTGQFFTDSSKSPVGNGESLPAPLKSSASPIGGSASSDSQSDTSQVATPNDLEVFEFGLQCNNGEVTDIRKKKTRKSTSSISRLFSRGKQRKSVMTPIVREFPVIDNNDQLPTRSSFAEKKRVWEMHKDIPMVCWKANMVVAWLEVECQMPMYTQMCYENIKSGKLLLELKDSELEAGLGIGSVMHRWKLRLAIEQHRDPTSVKYPEISTVDHLWVSRVWIRGLGLSQYCSVFETNMVDGRMLNALTKKDMEKYLNVNKKFHQWSILHGVELLRMIDFNKEFLMERRRKSEENDSDPLVWTNERVSKWCRSVDLGEYADSLRDSGVHGALLVLDPSFGADELAQALGIHSSKNIIRRHLTSELASVLLPARSVVSTGNIEVKGAQKQKRKRSLSFNAGSRASVPSDLAKSPLKRGSFRDSFLLRSSSRNTPTRANSAGANISNSIYPDAPRRSYSRSSRARPKSSLQ